MKPIALVLVVLGIVALAYGGISWTRKDTIIDAGPIEITADKRESVALPPIIGGVMLVAGLALLMMKK